MFCILKFHQLKSCQCFLLSNIPSSSSAFRVATIALTDKKFAVSVQCVPSSSSQSIRATMLLAEQENSENFEYPVLAMNGIFAKKCGFSEGDEVVVTLENKVLKCDYIEVQPLSVNDWEIVHLNASKIENQLLDQLQVVQKDLVFPIWIDQRLCIFLRVDRIEPPVNFCLLQTGAEFRVAPNLPSLKVKEPEESNSTLQAWEEAEIQPNRKSMEVEDQGNLAPIFSSIKFSCFSSLIQECLVYCETALHLLNDNAYQFGHLLIHGPQGSGASHTAETVAKQLKTKYNVFYSKMDCRTLRGKKVENVQKQLSFVLAECQRSSPSVLILDELDQLCNAGSSLEQINPGATILPARLTGAIISAVKSARGNGSEILIFGTGRSRTSFHPALVASRGSRFFTEIKSIPSLSANDRTKFLESVLQLQGAVETRLEEIVRKTDGLVIGDLKRLIDAGNLERIQRITGGSKHKQLTIEDLQMALKEFKTLNLRNVRLQQTELTQSWDDLGGLNEAKRVLTETLLWPAKYPNLYASCPLRLARGVLLYGPSGTGKTLIASVIAKECSMNFISVKGPELLSKYIGASEQSVRDTFTRARRAKPCLIFFDEFDALAPRRGHDSTGVTDRVVNQLLTELDGVEALEGVYVLAATSRPDMLDTAFLRPGRIDRFLYCGPPDTLDRIDILKALTRNMHLSDSVDFNVLGEKTAGFTGADIKSLLFTAQVKAAQNVRKDGSGEVTQDHLLVALKETKPSIHHGAVGKEMKLSISGKSIGQRVSLA